MSADMIDKEKKIKDTEKLYTNIRDVLSKQPDPQAAAGLSKVQNALRKRGEQLKVRNGNSSASNAFEENASLLESLSIYCLEPFIFALHFLSHTLYISLLFFALFQSGKKLLTFQIRKCCKTNKILTPAFFPVTACNAISAQ